MIENKLLTAYFIIRKIRYKINQNTALKIYDSLILSFLSYCNLIWGRACKTHLLNIYRLQKRALRVCCYVKNLNSKTLFDTCKKLTLNDINRLQASMLVHNFYYNTSILPTCIVSLFVRASSFHLHQTRSIDNLNLFIHFGRLNVRRCSVKINAPFLWNDIPIILKLI